MDKLLLRMLGGDAERYPTALEQQYPRILGKIMSLWNSPEIDAYFGDLLIAKRDREGFPPEVASEIMHLSLVHTAQHSENAQHDVWDNATLFADFVPEALVGEVKNWVDPPNEIEQEIRKLGIPCSPEGFLHASATGSRLAVTLFLDAEVNLETRDERGWTPLMLAAYGGRDEIVGLLLHKGAYVHTTDMGGNTALHWAAFSGHHISAKLLISSDMDVNTSNSSGLTPLVQAVAQDHTKLVLLLLCHNANPNTKERDGCTPLHRAATHGNTEIISALVQHGADIHATNQGGETPAQCAAKNHQAAAMKILKSSAEITNRQE